MKTIGTNVIYLKNGKYVNGVITDVKVLYVIDGSNALEDIVSEENVFLNKKEARIKLGLED